ncbi:MFS transporter [Tsukamurella sp. 1534]|uniref:MFS transporter n=1 Tax=Tsukamurella sp. 1534 TaxID=1151061 RepID=UPI000593334F|nr:MFS transporter [Tsukamurella sp. 1534]
MTCSTADPPVSARRSILVPLLTGILTTSLAVGMINTALPRLSADLGLSATARTWVADVYPLCLAVGIVVAARAGDAVGRRRVLALGLAVFAVGSAIAAATGTAAVLIGARAALGFAGAMIVASVVSTIGAVFDGHARTVANGLWVAVFGAATAIGPVLGGALTEALGWRAVFWASVPTALAAAAMLFLVPETRAEHRAPWDVAGIAASAAGLGLLVYGVHHVTDQPAIGVPAVILGGAALGWFVRHQRRVPHPVIDVELFGRWRFGAAAASMTVSAATAAASVYLLSIHLQAGGQGPFTVGLTLLPQALATTAGGLLAPALGRRVHRPAAISAALLLQSAGCVLVAATPAAIPGLILLGVGFGVVGTLGTTELFEHSSADQVAQVGAIQEVAFAVGSGAGIAVFGSLSLVAPPHGFTIALLTAAAACLVVAAAGRRRTWVSGC